jgi:hypothetical protein
MARAGPETRQEAPQGLLRMFSPPSVQRATITPSFKYLVFSDLNSQRPAIARPSPTASCGSSNTAIMRDLPGPKSSAKKVLISFEKPLKND